MLQSISRTRIFIFNNFFSGIYLKSRKKWRPKKWKLLTVLSFRKFVSAGLLAFIQTVQCSEKRPLDVDAKRVSEPERNISAVILQSDEYFKVGNYEESYKVLQSYEKLDNAEILWRLGRALYNMSKFGEAKHSEEVKMINHAFVLISRALKLDYSNASVQKWMAILLDAKSSLEGVKARLKTLPDFKKHLMYALELNPKDASTLYILGQYCFNIAGMPWYQRKIAATLFATPPEATFEEALFYFSKAEEVEPNFYSLNLLMLGKTYMQLKKIEAARYWLKCASTYPIRTEEDKKVRKEAEELLKKCPAATLENANGSFRGQTSHNKSG